MIIRAKSFNAGTKHVINDEPKAAKANFRVYKFTDRPRPTAADTLVVCNFSEFGCETLGVMYAIPRYKQRMPEKYIIAVGWYGREYLYRHLVDEFWELNEENQFLREYCRAFHHESRNLKKIEESLLQFGTVIPSSEMGRIVIGFYCLTCKHCTATTTIEPAECEKCGKKNFEKPLFSDIQGWKSQAVRIPQPSDEIAKLADKYLGVNPVGIFGRGRVTYGRNLDPEFYVQLIGMLEKRGYTPIWLGEKQSTIPCPAEHIIDFSRMPESRNLELTFAIINKLKFTIQFWTASTRLAGMMGVPYLLFESPDQIVGSGQEGKRLELTTFGKSKMVLSHYLNVKENPKAALGVVEQAVIQMENDDWRDMIGLVENEGVVRGQLTARTKGVA